MPHSQSFEALVLKTYDVGEADRLCVLFTRERGRLLARASGARRLQSRIGSSLLPFHHLCVELKEGSAGWIVVGVVTRGNQGNQRTDVQQFIHLEEGVELLLRLVTDEGTLPDVFDVTQQFFLHADHPHASLTYTFSLLHLLGLLPGETEITALQQLTVPEEGYLRVCRSGQFSAPDASCDLARLYQLRSMILEDHIHAPLKSAAVLSRMR